MKSNSHENNGVNCGVINSMNKDEALKSSQID